MNASPYENISTKLLHWSIIAFIYMKRAVMPAWNLNVIVCLFVCCMNCLSCPESCIDDIVAIQSERWASENYINGYINGYVNGYVKSS